MNRNLFHEHQILRQALAALEKNLTPDFKLEAPTKTNSIANTLARPADTMIRVKRQQRTWDFAVEVIPTLPRPHRFLLYTQKERFSKLVLITRFVNPIAAEEMKQQGLQFIDTAGNTYLNQDGLFLFIKGNRPTAEGIKTGKTFVFQSAGLKMVFALLCEQQLLNQTYRDIADAADVALGTVAILMKELRERSFLEKAEGTKLINKKELFQQWVTGYVHTLRPKLALGRFRADDRSWDHWQLEAGVWGGEIAAARYTNSLQPEFATIYATTEKMDEIVVKHRLQKDTEGNIEILKKFWMHPDPFPGLAHPIVAYADLIAIGNQRNLETAGMLYDNQILKFIDED